MYTCRGAEASIYPSRKVRWVRMRQMVVAMSKLKGKEVGIGMGGNLFCLHLRFSLFSFRSQLTILHNTPISSFL